MTGSTYRTAFSWMATSAAAALALMTTGCGENSLPALASTKSTTASSVSSASGAFAFSPNTLTVLPGSTTSVTPTGGTPPYKFTVVNAVGSLTVASGTTTSFVAPGNTATAVVEAVDSAAATATLVITVSTTAAGTTSSSSVAISPTAISVAEGGTVTFSSSGGTAPYTYAVLPAGAGSFSGSVYTAPTAAGTVMITVTDSAGATATSTVTVTAPTVTALSCSGSYSVVGTTAQGYLNLNEQTSGKVTGDLYVVAPGDDDDDDDDDFSVNGTCALVAGANTIDIKAPSPNYEFQGTYQADPSGVGVDMQGHYGTPGKLIYIWQAFPNN